MNSEKTNISENTAEKKPPTEVPTYLKHKPIYAINRYYQIDGHYKNNTDVCGISVGRAQWSANEFISSVKVFRYVNNRWSRQSEETTLTRAIDMAMLVIKTLDHVYNGKDMGKINSEFASLDIKKMTDNEELVKALNKYLNNEDNKCDIEAHIYRLEKALLSYRNK